jgi:hypothetical protein
VAKRKVGKAVGAALFALILWYFVSTSVYTLSHPEKTHAQVFSHTLKTLVLDFGD